MFFFPSFFLYLLVYGSLLMTGLGSIFLVLLLLTDYKNQKIW